MIGHATAELLERAATHALRGFLDHCGRDAPFWGGCRFEQRYRADYDDLEFELTFVGHAPLRWRISMRELRGALFGDVEHNYRTGLPALYSRLYEDHLIEFDLRRARAVVAEAVRSADPAAADHAQRWYSEYHDSVMRRHRGVSISQIHDPGDFRPLHPQVEAGVARHIAAARDHLECTMLGTFTEPEPSNNTLTMESLQRAVEMMRVVEPRHIHVQRDCNRVMWEMIAHLYGDDLVGAEVGTKDANARGLALLKEWLSPTQLASYERHKYFEVTGSHTGARYRIRHGRQQNIDELDDAGRKVAGLCFLPEGQLVAGDVMLAQKIALENDEESALKIANRWAYGDLPSAMGGYMYSGELSAALREQMRIVSPDIVS